MKWSKKQKQSQTTKNLRIVCMFCIYEAEMQVDKLKYKRKVKQKTITYFFFCW